MVTTATRLETRPIQDEPPPLRFGDNLSRAEFERRWARHPEVKRAELIDGLVFLEMSVGPDHGTSHMVVNLWLGTYWASRPELEACDNTTVRLPGENDLQPDSLLRRREESGGLSVRADEAIEGPPEFVFEVAASSVSYDLHQKKAVYERNGVPEYVVWQLFESRLSWFRLGRSGYEEILPGADGTIESAVFPGLRLHVPSLLAGDLPGLLAVLL